MKKSKKIILVSVAFLTIIAVCIYYTSFKKNNIKTDNLKDIWSIYDQNITSIKNIMDEITEDSNEFYWWNLKDFKINDKEYEQILNKLVADIRVCYMEFTKHGENYEPSNPILDYRNSKVIKKKDLELLRNNMYNNSSCLTRFDEYKALLISNNEEFRENFLTEINKIIEIKNSDLFKKEEPSFDELLIRKYIEVSTIDKLSTWLKSEYYKLK